MTSGTITVAADAIRAVREHGERTYPEECCGVIIGQDRDGQRSIDAMLPIDNVQDENRKRRFLISPSQYIAAEKSATDRGLELLGFYHSHPDHPAAPSAFDTEHALPWFTYMIVSVQNGKADKLTAWTLQENRIQFTECAMTVRPEHAKQSGTRNNNFTKEFPWR